MKIVYTVLLLASLALNAYLFLGQSDAEPEASLKDNSVINFADVSRTEKSDLESEIARLQSRLAQAEKDDSDFDSNSEQKSDKAEVAEVDYNDSLENPKRDEYSYEDIEQKNLAKVNQYQAEEIDPYWAYDSEEHIVSMITDSDLISEFSLQDVSCKTSMCKLTITPHKDTEQEAISILMGISILAFDSPKFRDYHTRSIPNEATDALDIYFYPAEGESD